MAKLTVYNYICPTNSEVCALISEDNTLTQTTQTSCDNPTPHVIASPPTLIDKHFILSFFSRISLPSNQTTLDLTTYESFIVDVDPSTTLNSDNRTITLPDPALTEDWICIKTNTGSTSSATLTLSNQMGIIFNENSSTTLVIPQDGKYIVFCKTLSSPIRWRRFTANLPIIYPNESDFINTTYLNTRVFDIRKNNNLTLVGGTYDEILRKRTTVYGIDNQNNSTPLSDINTQNGVYRIGGSAVLRNTNGVTVSSGGPFINSNTTPFITAATLTTTEVLPSGTYRLEISLLFNHSVANGTTSVRLRDSAVVNNIIKTFICRSVTANEITQFSWVEVIIINTTPPIITPPFVIDFIRSSASGASTLRTIFMTLWRLF